MELDGRIQELEALLGGARNQVQEAEKRLEEAERRAEAEANARKVAEMMAQKEGEEFVRQAEEAKAQLAEAVAARKKLEQGACSRASVVDQHRLVGVGRIGSRD